MTVRVSKPAINLREKVSELDKPTGLKGNELMRSETTQEARDLIGAGRKNLLINGACNVAQRGTTSTSTTYGSVDRMYYTHNGVNEACTQAQHALTSSDTGPWAAGFRNSYHITNGNQSGPDAADVIITRYLIEAQDIANSGWDYTSSSSYITLSFWVKASVAQTYYVRLESQDGTAQNYSFAIALSANIWTKITKTIPGNSNLQFDNNADMGLKIEWTLYRGTDSTTFGHTNDTWAAYAGSSRVPDMTGTWYTTNDATFEYTGIQLEVGSIATEFEHRSYGEELALCQRYYIQYGPNSALARFPMMGECTGASVAQYPLQFPVMMRGGTGGVSLTTNGSATDYQIYSANQSKPCSSITLAITFKNPDSGCWGVRINMNRTAGDLTAGRAAQAYAASTSILGFSREL